MEYRYFFGSPDIPTWRPLSSIPQRCLQHPPWRNVSLDSTSTLVELSWTFWAFCQADLSSSESSCGQSTCSADLSKLVMVFSSATSSQTPLWMKQLEPLKLKDASAAYSSCAMKIWNLVISTFAFWCYGQTTRQSSAFDPGTEPWKYIVTLEDGRRLEVRWRNLLLTSSFG